MAKKQQQTKKNDEPIGLDVQLNKGEAFIEKNWKIIAGAIVAIIVVVGGIFACNKINAGKNEDAAKMIVGAQNAFGMRQYEQALNGDGQTAGFLKVINEYGSTKTGNVAKLYAGLCYYNLDKYDEAIKMLEDFSPEDDQIVSPSAIAALGNCYIQKGDKEKGVKKLIEASDKADNDAVSPVFLLQAGIVYESMNQKDKALELYTKIKENYKKNAIAGEIEKYIERVK